MRSSPGFILTAGAEQCSKEQDSSEQVEARKHLRHEIGTSWSICDAFD